MRKTAWVTEQALGDQIWERKNELFYLGEGQKWFRELKIGNGYVDFAKFSKSFIELYELKITASIASVCQLAKYKKDLQSQIMNTFWFGPEKKIIEGEPEVLPHLVARYIDHEIFEFCNHIDICLWKVDVNQKGIITEISLVGDDSPNYELNDAALSSKLLEHFAVKQ